MTYTNLRIDIDLPTQYSSGNPLPTAEPPPSQNMRTGAHSDHVHSLSKDEKQRQTDREPVLHAVDASFPLLIRLHPTMQRAFRPSSNRISMGC